MATGKATSSGAKMPAAPRFTGRWTALKSRRRSSCTAALTSTGSSKDLGIRDESLTKRHRPRVARAVRGGKRAVSRQRDQSACFTHELLSRSFPDDREPGVLQHHRLL